ncbi:hypothetical protein LCGC14_2138490 [marine sediment metagenome]|uniref:Uncharacterized protein n=1 Tax=marine sediment metagenome TaxID=412755 RepID=A0A0F9ELC6_9ZZZZ
MLELFRTIIEELDSITSSNDKREYCIARSEDLFDEFFVPIDLPGPDGIIDPLLRTAIRPIVGRIFDEISKKLKLEN